MSHLNIEIKARCSDHSKIRNILLTGNAVYAGIDHQLDTYFHTESGRLKLREGSIENYLIYYERENIAGPKSSNVNLYSSQAIGSLKEILIKAYRTIIVVDKRREIYYIDNIKFHLDTVKELGTFIEIEAIDYQGNIGKEKLYNQCNAFLEILEIEKTQLMAESYSDLLIKEKKQTKITHDGQGLI